MRPISVLRAPRRTMLALLIAAVAGGTGCRATPAAASAAGDGANAGAAMSDAAVIRLERGACYGRCAEYAVALFDDGMVFFDGRRAVAATGVHRRRIAASAVQALLDRHAAAIFAVGDTLYAEGRPGCGKYRPDGPTLRLTVSQGARRRTMTFDSGCEAAPRSIPTFATAIDSVAGTAMWTTTSGGSPR